MRGRGVAALAVTAALSAGGGSLTAPSAAAADPLAALKAGCKQAQSKDAKPVAYRICTGRVPSFDGTELDASLTLPAKVARGKRLPLIVVLHGFLNSKLENMSQTRTGDGADKAGDAYKTYRFNNIWFARKGYAVLNYTARGNGESGGQLGLASKEIEVRDTRHLTGLLADDPAPARVDPLRVGVIGGSYGGIQAWLLLTTRPDASTQYGEWKSPRGKRVRLGVVVPQYSASDVLYSLAPNGRHLSSEVVDSRTRATPTGIGKQTILAGLTAVSAQKLPPEVFRWVSRFLAGEPYEGDPVIDEAKTALTRDRSGYYQDGFFDALRAGRQRRVPVLAANGWTDPIFPPIEAVRMYRRLRAARRDYPIQMYFGDFEHMTAITRVADVYRYHAIANRMFDHHLRRRGRRPRLDVRSTRTDCNPKMLGPLVKAPNFDALHPSSEAFLLEGGKQTTSPLQDPRAAQTDSALLEQQRPREGKPSRGCITTTLGATPGVATWFLPVKRDTTLLGMPRLTLRYRAVATDLELNSRLWDVAPDGTQTLVTRGPYRALSPNPSGDVADYELFGNHWRFSAGHQIMLEVTQDDSTSFRRNNFPSTASIDGGRLVFPTRP